MKIDPNLGLPGAQPASTERAGSSDSATGPKAPPTRSSGGTDEASFSSDAVTYSQLSAAIGQVPDIRQARVSALQQATQEGSYAVSNQQIAQAVARDYASSLGTP